MQYVVTLPESIGTFTDDELFDLCQVNPELRIERNPNQEIIIMSPTGFFSSYYNSRLNFLLNEWNNKHQSGIVTDSNGGYILPNGAMRVPDVAWISRKRLAEVPKDKHRKFLPACPEFIIELRSDSDKMRELKQKMEEWLANGVQLGWLVNPRKKVTFVYRPDEPVEKVKFSEMLSGYDMLPGLEANLEGLLDF